MTRWNLGMSAVRDHQDTTVYDAMCRFYIDAEIVNMCQKLAS